MGAARTDAGQPHDHAFSPRALADVTFLAQLGILFFVASLGSLVSAILTFYRSQSGYARHKAFVYAGRAADALMISIAVLTLTTCIIILVADPTT